MKSISKCDINNKKELFGSISREVIQWFSFVLVFYSFHLICLLISLSFGIGCEWRWFNATIEGAYKLTRIQ